ncbi:WYL domain-containing protein [Kitasatospora sp. NPDC001159]
MARRLATFSIEQIENAWELAPSQVDPALLAQLSAAAQQRELVRFAYRSIDRDPVEDDEVLAEPHRLVVWSGRWYLVA